MTKASKKPAGRKTVKIHTKPPTLHQVPSISDDEDTLSLVDIPTWQRLNNAYSEWEDPENTKSQRQLAREHNIGKSSLQDRIKGAKSKAQEAQERQRLTVLEELALKDWCQQLEAWGFPARIESLRRMVVEILFAKEDNQPLGHNWQAYFLERHPKLKSKFVPPLNKECATAQDPIVFQRYFDLFSTLVTIYKINPTDMYNMDEKGFMQGVIAKAKVIITREEHFKGKSYCIQDGNCE
jgi:hypothetical protein